MYLMVYSECSTISMLNILIFCMYNNNNTCKHIHNTYSEKKIKKQTYQYQQRTTKSANIIIIIIADNDEDHDHDDDDDNNVEISREKK